VFSSSEEILPTSRHYSSLLGVLRNVGYGTTLQDNTYKSFTYRQLNGGLSYQIEITTLDNREVCLKPEGVTKAKCS
jgi:hypothetical protein